MQTDAAASALFSLLDDGCDLGGVMQSVALTLCTFPVSILVAAFLSELPSTFSRAPDVVCDVLRFLLLSEDGHRHLLSAAPALDYERANRTRTLLVKLGRFERYAAITVAVLDVLPSTNRP
jgi:hypothetical protein